MCGALPTRRSCGRATACLPVLQMRTVVSLSVFLLPVQGVARQKCLKVVKAVAVQALNEEGHL